MFSAIRWLSRCHCRRESRDPATKMTELGFDQRRGKVTKIRKDIPRRREVRKRSRRMMCKRKERKLKEDRENVERG